MVSKLFSMVCFGFMLCAIAVALLFVGGIGNIMLQGLEPVFGHVDLGILDGVLDTASNFVRGIL